MLQKVMKQDSTDGHKLWQYLNLAHDYFIFSLTVHTCSYISPLPMQKFTMVYYQDFNFACSWPDSNRQLSRGSTGKIECPEDEV